MESNGKLTNDIPKYIRLKEAAYIVNMGPHWLWQRIGKRHGPPFVRRGRHILFPLEEFKKWASQKIIP